MSIYCQIEVEKWLKWSTWRADCLGCLFGAASAFIWWMNVTTCKIKLFEQCALCAKWLKITSFVFITCLWNIRNTRLPLHTPRSHPKSYIIIFLFIKKATMHKENINFSTYLYRMMSYWEIWERLYIYFEVYSQSWCRWSACAEMHVLKWHYVWKMMANLFW